MNTKLTKREGAWLVRNWPKVEITRAFQAAKDAAWFAAPGLSDDEHALWVRRLVAGFGPGDDLPLGLFEDAGRRFSSNLRAIDDGIPGTTSHFDNIEIC